MRKYLKIVCFLLVVLNFTGCTANKVENTLPEQNTINNEQTSAESSKNEEMVVESKNQSELVFLSVEEGAEVLSKDDDYISKLSKFDYISKFKKDSILNQEERKKEYLKTIIDYENTEKEKITEAYNKIMEKIKPYNLNLPEKIGLVNTKGLIEAGAAYTRENVIVMPETFIKSIDRDTLESILTHELFHVYSRYNKDKREALYGIIHYQKCESLEIPESLKNLTISNPDAPDLNYYINSQFNGKSFSWLPITYSKVEYNKEKNDPFFAYLNDDMLAVEIINNKPVPLLDNGKLIILKKDQLDDYYDLIGQNTNYTYHPEETIADNFVLMVQNKDSEVNSPWVLEEMRELFKSFE